jgi:tetratricopeptide (TPR) repeat protein
MRPETWPRVRTLFDAALDLGPRERHEFLVRECGGDAELRAEVEALLQAEAGADPSIDGSARALLANNDLAGTSIGGFRLGRQLGAGGMGTVYEAQQLRPQRTVALKTLAVRFPSERARRRFEDEADILARLRHPGIAQVLEAGTAKVAGAEVPWFAMELVEEPRAIDRFAKEQALDARAIVALVHKVCGAVGYAHQRGVIHRDLKPANVLVDRQGQPKVIDFGIARLTERDAVTRFTRTGEILGTLAYMSPERLERADEQDDTGADVYALGVILYQMLAGRLPFALDELPPARVIDVLRASEPPPPSRTNTALPRELDWITLKAIDRDPGRRYASVGALAEDLARFLGDERVFASPPSATYRLRKLARRHRVLLATAAAVFVAVSVGLVIAVVGWWRVAGAERIANRKVATMEAINSFQQRILGGAHGNEKGRDLRLVEVVDAAARDLDAGACKDPAVESAARGSIGSSYTELGLYAEAERHLLRARALLEAHGFDPHDKPGMGISNNLAMCYQGMGRLDVAEREARTSLADARAAYGDNHEQTATRLSNLAGLLLKTGGFTEALALASEAASTFATVHGERSAPAINAHAGVASALDELGRAGEAEHTFAQARERAADLHQDDPTRLAVASVYGNFLFRRGRHAASLALFEEVAAVRERVLGPHHPQTLTAWKNVASAKAAHGDYAGGEAALRRVAAGEDALGIDGGERFVTTRQNLAHAVRRQGRAAEAEAMAHSLLATAERTLPAGHWLIGIVTKERGGCRKDLGRHAEAEADLLAAVQLLEKSLVPTDYRMQRTFTELVELYEAWPRPADAAVWRSKLVRGK